MDLAQRKPNYIPFKLLSWFSYLPGLWLFYHLINLCLNSTELHNRPHVWLNLTIGDQILSEFKIYRNFFYLLYIIVFIALGIVFTLQPPKNLIPKQNQAGYKSPLVSYLLPDLIRGLILVTITYALVALLFNFYEITWLQFRD